MILVIDNYDSFTYNLVQLLAALGAEVEVRRNDALTAEEALALEPAGIVVSPGPARRTTPASRATSSAPPPRRACRFSACVSATSASPRCTAAASAVPPRPMHGKTDEVSHDGEGVFTGIPSPFTATRYHSLCVEARQRARRARGRRDHTRRRHHGAAPPRAADLRRPVPSRERADARGHEAARELPRRHRRGAARARRVRHAGDRRGRGRDRAGQRRHCRSRQRPQAPSRASPRARRFPRTRRTRSWTRSWTARPRPRRSARSSPACA